MANKRLALPPTPKSHPVRRPMYAQNRWHKTLASRIPGYFLSSQNRVRRVQKSVSPRPHRSLRREQTLRFQFSDFGWPTETRPNRYPDIPRTVRIVLDGFAPSLQRDFLYLCASVLLQALLPEKYKETPFHQSPQAVALFARFFWPVLRQYGSSPDSLRHVTALETLRRTRLSTTDSCNYPDIPHNNLNRP